MKKISELLNKLGPGLMYAGAAVGVSHLVQSTKAGAQFGLQLIVAVILIHIIKYPFFEYGPRYTAATGRNILHGYKAVGKWAVWTYVIMTIATMFIIQAVITLVTSALAVKIFELDGKYMGTLNICILLFSTALLALNRITLLDKAMKFIILTLTAATICAVLLSVGDIPQSFQSFSNPFDFDKPLHIAFLVGFLGWMPAPFDVSVWHSIWSEDKYKAENKTPCLKSSLIDFRIGYIGTACLAICFLALGAFFMYGSGEKFSPKGAVFAGQFISLYESALGPWAKYIIGVAAMTTMFSTTITCLDAFPRSLRVGFEVLSEKEYCEKKRKNVYLACLITTTIGSILVLSFWLSNMGTMVKVATAIAFLIAPVIAILNYLTIHHEDIPAEASPSKFNTNLARLSIVLLISFSLYYAQSLIPRETAQSPNKVASSEK